MYSYMQYWDSIDFSDRRLAIVARVDSSLQTSYYSNIVI